MPADLDHVIAIAAGTVHSLALKENGTVVGWGSDYYGQTIMPTNLNGVVAIAAGGTHSLALKSDGTEKVLAKNKPVISCFSSEINWLLLYGEAGCVTLANIPIIGMCQ